MEELKKVEGSWDEGAGRFGEYGGRRPTAVLGRLVGIAPWTGFWTRRQTSITLNIIIISNKRLAMFWNTYIKENNFVSIKITKFPLLSSTHSLH